MIPRLQIVRDSATNNTPMPWVQIHIVPDYVYFNHSVHVTRGISCVECHGRIDQMDEVRHDKSLSMSFCLDCHRDPAAHIRPPDKVTELGWQWSTNAAEAARCRTQRQKICPRLESRITPELFRVPPMKCELRNTIYDRKKKCIGNICSAPFSCVSCMWFESLFLK